MIISRLIVILRYLRCLRSLERVIRQRFNDADLFLDGCDHYLLGVIREGQRCSSEDDASEDGCSELQLCLRYLIIAHVEPYICNKVLAIILSQQALRRRVCDKLHF